MNEDINKGFCTYSQTYTEEKISDQRVFVDWKKWSRPLSSGVVTERLASMSSVVPQERDDRMCCRCDSRERLLRASSLLVLTGDRFFSFAIQSCGFTLCVRTRGSAERWKGWLSQLSMAAASPPELLPGSLAHLGHQVS